MMCLGEERVLCDNYEQSSVSV